MRVRIVKHLLSSACCKAAVTASLFAYNSSADDEVPNKSIMEVSAAISGAGLEPFVEVPDFVPRQVNDSLVPGSLGYFVETNAIALPVDFRFWRKHPNWRSSAEWESVTNDLPQPTWVQTNYPGWFVSKSKYGWMLDPSGCTIEGGFTWFNDEDWELAHYYPGRADFIYETVDDTDYRATATAFRDYPLTNSICYPRAMLMTPDLYAALLSTCNAYFSRLYYGSESSAYEEWDTSRFGPVEPCPEFRWNAMGGDTHFEMSYPSNVTLATLHKLLEGENKLGVCKKSESFVGTVVADDSDSSPGFVYRPGWMTSAGRVNAKANSQQIWWSTTDILPPLVQQINEELQYTPTKDDFGLFPSFGWTKDPIGIRSETTGAITPVQKWECFALTMQNLVGSQASPCQKLFNDVGYGGDVPVSVAKGYSTGFTNLQEFLAWKFPVSATKYSNRRLARQSYMDDVWERGAKSMKLEPWGYVGANQALSLASSIIHIPSIALTTWNRHVDATASQRYRSYFEGDEGKLTLRRGEDGYWHPDNQQFWFKLVKNGDTTYTVDERYAGESGTIDLIVDGCNVYGYDDYSTGAVSFDMPSFSFSDPIKLREDDMLEFFDEFCRSGTFLLEEIMFDGPDVRLIGSDGFTLGPPAEFGLPVEGSVSIEALYREIDVDLAETGTGFNLNLSADYAYTAMASNRVDVGKLYPGKNALRDDIAINCRMAELKKRVFGTNAGTVEQYAGHDRQYDMSAPASSLRAIPNDDFWEEREACRDLNGHDPLDIRDYCGFADGFDATISYLPEFSATIGETIGFRYPEEGNMDFRRVFYWGEFQCPFVIDYTAGSVNAINTYTGSCDIVRTTTTYYDGFVTTTATTNLYNTGLSSREEHPDIHHSWTIDHYDHIPYTGERWPSEFEGVTVQAHETTNTVSYITYWTDKYANYSGPELDIDIIYTNETHSITNERTIHASFQRYAGFDYKQDDHDTTNTYPKVVTVIPSHQRNIWKNYACEIYWMFTRYGDVVTAVRIAHPIGGLDIPPNEFQPYGYAELPLQIGRREVSLSMEGQATGRISGAPGPCEGDFESHVNFKTIIKANFGFPTMAVDPVHQGENNP